MKNKYFLHFAVLLLIFSACKEDNYAEWKILNDAKYAQEFASTTYTKSPSGLCYNILYGGAMKQANPTSFVTVKYSGTLITGKVFDSGTYVGYLANTVKGWQEAVSKLKIGGSMVVFMPASLGYGTSGSGAIAPYSMLYFTIELVDAQD
ncbi:MAG: hypothetical protein AUK44_01700 [Porphyromonadaceae bacterium CG2_30_38_12]|nr:MAG: hypothetical protein AUK44_01700 [Porphyromonadaceae bacterium CG2_30_38_12]